MPVYTLRGTCQPILRDADEGWLFEFAIMVVRDGVDVRGFIQRLGESLTNPEIAAVLRPMVDEIIEEDYAAQNKASRDARATQLQAILEGWTKSLP